MRIRLLIVSVVLLASVGLQAAAILKIKKTKIEKTVIINRVSYEIH
jgi:hypothetical protein